jgi:hypothetical protein
LTAIINREGVPEHLFSVPQLDFSGDLFAERVDSSWFRLGAWTITPRRNYQNVETDIIRQSFLLVPQKFAKIYNELESIGNRLNNMGKPGGSIIQETEHQEYKYYPFHQFPFWPTSIVGEPLVFARSGTSSVNLFVNPDIWLYFELEETSKGSCIWHDPRRGVDALRQLVIDDGNLKVAEIRSDYLLKYLQARQMSLIVGHYHQLLLFDPTPISIEAFVKKDITLGGPEQGAKAILQNWGLRRDDGDKQFLQRRLHLWFEVSPPEIDACDPWANEPSFDPYKFTLPTCTGLVAPARWKSFRKIPGRTFDGEACEFMDRVYFRQEVLTKYEASSGFKVHDNGSVSSRYWGLTRSTSRLGNEILCTAIGDFAEGVPFEEWPHWQQYVVEKPSHDAVQAIVQEKPIPDAVNSLVNELQLLNPVFAHLAELFQIKIAGSLWSGSLDSLAGRQLKWVYPADADDDEFLKRATLASTLVIEGLESGSLRKFLGTLASGLHQNDETPPRSLNSRNLLQRATLVAVLIEKFCPDVSELPVLVKQAEGKAKNGDPDLQAELERYHKFVRDQFAPLAFLYDLRIYGGVAHQPSKARIATAAKGLGLPASNWHRTDYLRLLGLLAESVRKISNHLDLAGQVIETGII